MLELEDIEVALEDLDSFVECARQNYSMAGFLGVVHSANLIRESLEKQTPRQVEYEEYETNYGEITTINRHNHRCPICKERNAIFDYNGQALDYCGRCGQKLNWSGD